MKYRDGTGRQFCLFRCALIGWLTGTVASEVVLLRAHSEGNGAMRLALFWDFTQRWMVVPKRRDETTSCTAWPWKMGPIGCFETSVRNYLSTLRKIPKSVQISFTSRQKHKITQIEQYFGRTEVSGMFSGKKRQGTRQVKFGCTQDNVGLRRTNKLSDFFRVTEPSHTVNQSINQSLKQSSTSKLRPLRLFGLQGNPSPHAVRMFIPELYARQLAALRLKTKHCTVQLMQLLLHPCRLCFPSTAFI